MTEADIESVRKLVDAGTYGRGAAYAHGGAVIACAWEADNSRLVGEIQGSERAPYRASVTVTRSATDRITRFEGICSCPVGYNCKHVVALLLTQVTHTSPPPGREVVPTARPVLSLVRDPSDRVRLAASRAEPPARARGSATSWEEPLRALLGDDWDVDREPESGEIALQFELVASRPRPGVSNPGPGIRIRPVVLGRSGKWVRTGVSWSNLEYPNYRRLRISTADEKLNVCKELLALSRLTGNRGYYYGEDVVWLESINSRRLWDLLAEAEDVGVPLVMSSRKNLTVAVHRPPTEVSIDVTRVTPGLRLRPHVPVDDGEVPLASALLIGAPVHGIAWWDRVPGFSDSPRVHLSPFTEPLSGPLRDVLGRGPLTVPTSEEERFLETVYPALSRRVRMSSSDGSVALPEVGEGVLALSVHHGEGHRIEISWARCIRGSRVSEELRGSSWGSLDPPIDRAIVAATAIARGLPALLETSAAGYRLVGEVELGGMDAVRFVTSLLPAFAEVEGLEIDQTGTISEYREETEPPVVAVRGDESRNGDWFDLEVVVSVGGEEVSFGELFVALAEQRSHLILPSGTYFSLDREELRALATLIVEARALHEGGDDRIRLSRFQADLWGDIERLGVMSAQATAWGSSMRALAEAGDRTEHPVPDGLDATLRPYQEVGFNWLVYLFEHHLGGILADDMGLGKTLQALALICHVRERGLSEAPFLVVAPTSVVANWALECDRFVPEVPVAVVTETTRRRGVSLAEVAGTAGVVITSYALFRLEYDAYAEIEWAGLFLDEAQFAKNPASHTYRAAKMLPVGFKVAMTGTPMENNLGELWSLFSIAAPGLFPRSDRFAQQYRVPIEKSGDVELLAQLRRRMRPLMLRRTKEQVAADLPDKQEQILELELNPRHMKLYQTYLHRERQKILGLIGELSKNRFEIFRSLTLLRQAALDISLIDPAQSKVQSTKLDSLIEMLDEIVADGHRVLVFSQFTRFLAIARQRLESAGIGYCYLDGRTRKREQVIAEFRTGVTPVFLISLKAGGFGLNLTEADYCILLDPWWNPATEAQAVDRIHRIGQIRKVMVYRLVAKDTIEEKVMALKARKAALFSNVIDGGGFESGALTAADIRDLLE